MRIIPPRAALSLILLFLFSICPAFAAAQGPDETYQIGMEAYVYFYPLVTMDLTRRQKTNIESGKMAGRAPMNTFAHMRAFSSGIA